MEAPQRADAAERNAKLTTAEDVDGRKHAKQ